MTGNRRQQVMTAIVAFALSALFAAPMARAHCDTLDGPVVADARVALDKGDVAPVLKWVGNEHEQEIREAFARTLSVRTKGADARQLADRYFFETLVRVHRAGEGAAYMGLKPAGTDPGTAVAAADAALASGSADRLVQLVADRISQGIRERHAHALNTRKHADHNVEAGRQFVRAYVEFVHYVERIYENSAATESAHATRPAVTHTDEIALRSLYAEFFAPGVTTISGDEVFLRRI